MDTQKEWVAKVAGESMAKIIASEDESFTERLSVADLWTVVNHVLSVTMTAARPVGVSHSSPEEKAVRSNKVVRDHIIAGRKIDAIKEARTITGVSLKEAKDMVEAIARELKRTT